ncbi:hypothetical protein Dimus_018971 [Dionaea muscipula]
MPEGRRGRLRKVVVEKRIFLTALGDQASGQAGEVPRGARVDTVLEPGQGVLKDGASIAPLVASPGIDYARFVDMESDVAGVLLTTQRFAALEDDRDVCLESILGSRVDEGIDLPSLPYDRGVEHPGIE